MPLRNVPSLLARRKLMRAVVCALAIGLEASLAAGQSAAPLPLPNRLTDAEFWHLVTESSEAGGVFLSDNWTSNEMTYPTIIAPTAPRSRRSTSPTSKTPFSGTSCGGHSTPTRRRCR